MNAIKIKDFINAYSQAMNMNDDLKGVLTELMCNIVAKYEKVIPGIPVSKDDSKRYVIKPNNGYYSVEDFFLNRLTRNIWEVDSYSNENDNLKGAYMDANMKIFFNDGALNKQLERYKNVIKTGYDDKVKSASKKVKMHEFEHAFKTKLSDNLDFLTRKNYKNIVNNINSIGNGRYKSILRDYDEIAREPEKQNSLYSIFNGTKCHHSILPENSMYLHSDYQDNLNEILNESECLEMSGHNVNLYASVDGNTFTIRNPESSNYQITNYGDMFKIVFGATNSFELMYLNPPKMFEKFNELYNDVFQKEYNSNQDAMLLFMKAITDIKKNTNGQRNAEHLKLNKVMAECLQKRVSKFLQNPSVTNEQILDSISEFERFMIFNPNDTKNNELDHIKVLNNIKSTISNRNINTVQQQSKQANISVSRKNQNNNHDSGKYAFAEELIEKYDLIEDDNQLESREENEDYDMQRISQFIASKGINKTVIAELLNTRIIKDKNGNDKNEYTKKHVTSLVRLLKASKELDQSLSITDPNQSFYKQFIDIPQIEYILKQLYDDRKDTNSYIYEMGQQAMNLEKKANKSR